VLDVALHAANPGNFISADFLFTTFFNFMLCDDGIVKMILEERRHGR